MTEISEIVANYSALAAPIANRIIGSITAVLSRTQNGAGESSLGDIIADAQLAATAPAAKGGAVVAFMNPGGIRADLSFPSSAAGEGDGQVTYGESFTVQPFGNSLVVKTLSGQQIYDLLEQQWGAAQPFARILEVSRGFSYAHTFDTTAANFAAQGIAFSPAQNQACIRRGRNSGVFASKQFLQQGVIRLTSFPGRRCADCNPHTTALSRTSPRQMPHPGPPWPDV